MIAALREAGSDVARYTEYPGYGHGSWMPAYGDEKNFDWLFSKKRVDLPDWTPVTLKNAAVAAPADTYEIAFSFSADGGASWKRAMVRRLGGFPLTLVEDKVVSSPGFVFREPERGKWTLSAPEGCKVSFRDVKCRALSSK
jgi:hypothetical protein